MTALETKCGYAESHYTECHYAECHYTECHFAECGGAVWPGGTTFTTTFKNGLNISPDREWNGES